MDKILPKKVVMFSITSKKDWFDDLSSEEKQEIEIGLRQAENVEFISHETVMNRFAKWH